MTDYTFNQLVDLPQVQQLLEAHHRLSGMAYGLFDAAENNLISVGWQDICVRFHRVNPVTSARCRKSNAYLLPHPHEFEGDFLEHRCENGMIDVAMPIIISGEHLATFYAGQFFYDDDLPDIAFFRIQGEKLGFDVDNYLMALGRVPVFSREYVRKNICFLSTMVNILSEAGLSNLKLVREMEERKTTQTMLENKSLLLETLIQTLPDPVWLKDVNGVFLACNAAFGRLYDDSPSGIVGRKDNDYVDDELAAFFQQKDREAISAGQPRINEEWVTYASDGHRALWETTKTRVCDAQGLVVGALGVARDITERKRMEEALTASEQEFRTLAENSPDVIVRYDRECRRIYVNPAFEKINHLSSQEVLGKTPVELSTELAPMSASFTQSLKEVMETGVANQIDLTWTKEGIDKYWFVRAIPEFEANGDMVSALTIWTDITERKRAEHALLDKKQRLADMAVELSMVEERERRRLATNLHDNIGQDLALARIKLGMLAKGSLTGEEIKILGDARGTIDGIIKSVRIFTRLISPPILESAGLEAALKWLGIQVETDYNLRVLFKDDLCEKTVSKEIRSELYFAVRELLINIAKHAKTDSAQIAVGRENGRIVIRVEDDGIGFDPDFIEANVAREMGGFGLFNIRRRIIFLGGTFKVESARGGGTRVTIGMPLAQDEG